LLKIACAAALLVVFGTGAFAQAGAAIYRTIPASSFTVTDWYKQSVYDPKGTKIGEIMDVLVDKSGRVSSLIVGVGFWALAKKTWQSLSMPCTSQPKTTIDGILS
jgi:sporulation protein YlmC with PRC-barrel domain